MPPLGSGQRLMFKNEKEPPRKSFSGAQLADEPQIVLLKFTAVRVGFLRQFSPHRLHMAVDVCTFCQYLKLYLHRRNFQVADKRVDDIPLFLGTAEEEVDRNDLQYFDIAAIPGIDDSVLNLFHRNIV